MINPNDPDQIIPTLNEVVPLEGARSISFEQLLYDSRSLIGESSSNLHNSKEVNDLADAVLSIVSAKLVKILPDLMREAVDEVLSQETDLNS